MHKTLLFALLLLPLFAVGQTKSSLDFMFGTEYSHRVLMAPNEPVANEILETRGRIESGKLNFRLGFNYNHRLTRKLWIKSGVRLASVGYNLEKSKNLRYGSEYSATGQYVRDPSLPHEFQLVWDHFFLELPIVGRFEFNAKRFSPFVEIGVSPNIYLTTRTQQITDLDTKTEFARREIPDINKLSIVGSLSFGWNYRINSQLQAFGQPIFRYHFTRTMTGIVGEHLFNFGLEIGIRKTWH